MMTLDMARVNTLEVVRRPKGPRSESIEKRHCSWSAGLTPATARIDGRKEYDLTEPVVERADTGSLTGAHMKSSCSHMYLQSEYVPYLLRTKPNGSSSSPNTTLPPTPNLNHPDNKPDVIIPP